MKGLPSGRSDKESVCQCGRCKRGVWSLGQDDPLEEEVATHSSVLAWRIIWTEEPDGYSPRGGKQSDMTEHEHAYMQVTGNQQRGGVGS